MVQTGVGWPGCCRALPCGAATAARRGFRSCALDGWSRATLTHGGDVRFTLGIVLTLLICAGVSPAHGQASDTQQISSAILGLWNHGGGSNRACTVHDDQGGHRGAGEPLGDQAPATPTPEP